MSRFTGPEYSRLFAGARRSLERTGGDLTGGFAIPDPTDAERKAIGGLVGTYPKPGARRIQVELAPLDDAVRARTGSGLVEVLQTLGPPLRNRPELAREAAQARAALLEVATSSPLYGSAGWFRDWVQTLRTDGSFTKLIKQPLRFGQAVGVLERIDGALVPLPKLAGAATGHTHALDHPRPLSSLVLSALAARAGVQKPGSAEERRDLWDRFNVIVDDLASRVLALNLEAGGTGLAEWLTGAASYGTPFQVTLHQILTHPIQLRHPVVHVCENPAVLREAAEELGPQCGPLLCTEGQPSTAFHRLAEKITGSGGEIRYHGDFDWPGVEMAAALIGRHGATPWRLGAGDYLAAATLEADHVKLDGARRPTPWDPELGGAMARVGRPVFEETVTALLLEDLRRDRSVTPGRAG